VIEEQVADFLMIHMKVPVEEVVHSLILVLRNHVVFAMLSKEVNVIVVTVAVSHMKMILMLGMLVAALVVQVLAMLSKKVNAHVVTVADLRMKCQLLMVLLNHVVFAMLSKTVNVIVDQPADSVTKMAVPQHQEVEEGVFAMLSKEVNVIVVTVAALLMNLLIPTNPAVVEEVFAMLSKEVNVIVARVADSVMKLPLLNSLKDINCARRLSGTLGNVAQFVG
jgi:hypothetical protein